MSTYCSLASLKLVLRLTLVFFITACAHRGQEHFSSKPSDTPNLAFASWMETTAWQHQTFPTKRATVYRADRKAGRDALMASAAQSMSVLRQRIRVEPQALGALQFSWLAHEALARADVALREADDAKLRIVLSFEGDRSRFSARNRMLSELSQALTGEELPYATLMYVWCNKRQAGEIITNPRTDRIRKIVVESGSQNLGQWLDFERNIREDYIAAFGEEPGALTSIALMTDTDNTQSRITAWYGPVRLQAK